MAAIGEQLSDSVFARDDIVGISVGRREKSDNISIWNLESKYAGEARLADKIYSLAPGFPLSFRDYKGEHFFFLQVSFSSSTWWFISKSSFDSVAHKTLDASEVNKFSKRNANNLRLKNQQNNNYQLNSNHFSAYRSNNNSRHHSPSGFQNSK